MSQAVLMLFPAAMNFTEPVPGLIALGAAMVAVIVTVGVAGYGVVGALLNAVVVDAVTVKATDVAGRRLPSAAVSW